MSEFRNKKRIGKENAEPEQGQQLRPSEGRTGQTIYAWVLIWKVWNCVEKRYNMKETDSLRNCYCKERKNNPAVAESMRDIPEGFCGICDVCGKPGHTNPTPISQQPVHGVIPTGRSCFPTRSSICHDCSFMFCCSWFWWYCLRCSLDFLSIFIPLSTRGNAEKNILRGRHPLPLP